MIEVGQIWQHRENLKEFRTILASDVSEGWVGEDEVIYNMGFGEAGDKSAQWIKNNYTLFRHANGDPVNGTVINDMVRKSIESGISDNTPEGIIAYLRDLIDTTYSEADKGIKTKMCDICMGGGYLLEPETGATPTCQRCDGSGRIPNQTILEQDHTMTRDEWFYTHGQTNSNLSFEDFASAFCDDVPKTDDAIIVEELTEEISQLKQEYIQSEKVIQARNIDLDIAKRDDDDKQSIINKQSKDISNIIDGIKGRDCEIISKRKEIQRLNGMILDAFLAGADLQREKTRQTSTLGYNDFVTWQEMVKGKELKEMGS